MLLGGGNPQIQHPSLQTLVQETLGMHLYSLDIGSRIKKIRLQPNGRHEVWPA